MLDYFQLLACGGRIERLTGHSGTARWVIGPNGFRFPAVTDDYGSVVAVPPFRHGLAILRAKAEQF